MPVVDLAATPLRELNQSLHQIPPQANDTDWQIVNPKGAHAIAVGIDADVSVTIDGPVGYYCAGMNKRATVTVRGNAGTGVAENMMSGRVHVLGSASQSAGATGRGGFLLIDGDTSARCGISMKGIDIVVKGSIGAMSAFMAQAGNLVVLGDAGEALGASIYEARIFVRGKVASLGADCVEKPMGETERTILAGLLASAGLDAEAKPEDFRFYGSARRLYQFHTDNIDGY